MNPQVYDRTIIMFSGGKDSLACVLWAIENNCPNIELWHHLVDGTPVNEPSVKGQTTSTLMDWPITSAYCKAVARLLSLSIYFSWLEGGFEREMLRSNQAKAKTWFDTPDGLRSAGGNGGKKSTRQKFPQVSADLSVRWCSAYLKVDVSAIAIRNQPRFNHSKTLVITGERAEESPARANYAEFEPDRTDNRDGKSKRHVDRFRPIHGWDESKVWAIIQRHGIIPHPAYHLGWGRLSCMSCIFGSANQWATIRKIAPEHFEQIANYEQRFCTTIQRKRSVRDLADLGTPYAEANNNQLVKMALSSEWGNYPIWTHPQAWALPAGAYGESNGPT